MKLIYKIIFILSAFLIYCCSQNTKNPTDDTRASAPFNQLSSSPEEEKETLTDKPIKVQTPKEVAYDALTASFNALETLYHHKDEGFDISSLFEEINKKFNKDSHRLHIQDVQDKVTYSISGNINCLENLKKIVLHSSITNKDEYMKEQNAKPLIYKLSDIAKHSINIILKDDNKFGKGKLEQLQQSQNIQGINTLKDMLDDMHSKWQEIVKSTQDIIEKAAQHDSKDNIIEELKPILTLETLKDDQVYSAQENGDPKLCKLKNQFKTLCSKVIDQVQELLNEINPAP
ncbi:hypothetical protein BDCR2A_01125 [Borrelia duttonii CR2A]|uniref:Antigen P35 n=1 Tax=Borrelia duttonii CR2A TaxID=1432657 RepID=W6THD0_9SPIR|nr:hypothetical protein [Borrelia duttonii]ETZ17930.1 hypothetical protein BDCR2A_01125 [Borrelia duttonii CR2A]